MRRGRFNPALDTDWHSACHKKLTAAQHSSRTVIVLASKTLMLSLLGAGASNEYEEEEEEYEDVDAPASGDSTGSESGKGGFLSRAWNATKKAAATASSKLARRAETNPRLKAAAEACRHPLAHPGGGLINTDTEGVAVSRQVVAEVAREVGKKLMAGQNLLSVTFSVRCCQPKTILEVASGQFVFCPEYLTRAAEESDPVSSIRPSAPATSHLTRRAPRRAGAG